jgi:hypothetical protein
VTEESTIILSAPKQPTSAITTPTGSKLSYSVQQAAQKLAAEKLAAERLEKEKQSNEKLTLQKQAAEKLAAERLASERIEKEKENEKNDKLALLQQQQRQKAAANLSTSTPQIPSSNTSTVPLWKQRLIDSKKVLDHYLNLSIRV